VNARDKRFDVAVVGGGPAGSIAALTLVNAGLDTVLIEKDPSPRDKVCGDALIPDSVALLQAVGLLDRVRSRGHTMGAIRVYSPNGRHMDVRGDYITVRRLHLDALLLKAAQEAGVHLITAAASGFDTDDGEARVHTREGVVRAHIAILATGAASKMLAKFGVEHRSQPSAIALRAYYRFREDVPEDRLHIWYEKPILPGYGWIFPMGDHLFNVGAGVFSDGGARSVNLHDLFGQFCSACPAAEQMMRGAELVVPVKGAPIRSALTGAAPSGNRLLLAGETLGSTYNFSGEGIGKAMETGRLAAQVAAQALGQGDLCANALRVYDDALEERFREKFRHYQVAQRWLSWEPAINLMTWKANRSERVRTILEDVVTERRNPTEILSLWGMAKALLLP
jgi:geranylgeranyl reductase family protein